MRFHRQIIQLISVIYIVNFTRAKKLCDIRVWYLNLITDDVFDVDLTDEQLNLKNSIESLVLKASESRETRMVHCSVLYMYNDMLKDSFNYTPSISGMSLKEVETDNDNDVKNADMTPDTEDKAEEQFTENTGEISETNDGTDATNTNTVEENLENYGNKDLHDSQNAMEDTEESVSTDDEHNIENIQTDKIDHLSTEETTRNLDRVADNIDETELLEDSDPDLSLSHDFSEEVVQPNQKNADETQRDKENELSANEEELFVTSSIPFGVCWSFGCLMSDIFDVYNREGLDDVSQELKDKPKSVLKARNKPLTKRKVKIKCPIGQFCTLKCFYKFLLSKSFCMKDYVYSISLPTKKIYEPMHYSNKDIQYEKKSMDADSGHFGSPRDMIIESNAETEGPVQTLHKTNSYSSIKYVANAREDIDTITNAKEEQNRNAKGRENHGYFTENSDESKLSRTEFENILERKTSQYYSKIQTIEVMIMKLENKLLMEALNKQNHSSTITKLENQILKLENELLKMNKNYQNLREESESMSRRQNRYLELAYKKSRKEYPKLPDHSKEKYELITQHQTKINELAEVLRNQSSIIMELKGKYESLEEQNKMLHQMVMNQTIFMSSIVKTVQDLTDQNIKNQNEIKVLKQKVETHTGVHENVKGGKHKNRENVIDDLDTLLFNNMLQKRRSAHNGKESSGTEDIDEKDEEDARSNMKDDVEKKSVSNIITNWCPRDNRTCPSCHYSPIVYSSCIPFRNIVWSTCKVNNFEEQKVADSDYPTIPDVKDEGKGNEIYNNGQDTNNIQKHEFPAQSSETEEETFDDNLKVVQNDDGRVSEQSSEDTSDSLNREEATHSGGTHAFGRYIIVGYDKDGKPVFRIRENTVDKEKSVETATEEDKNSFETNSEAKSNGISLQVSHKEESKGQEDIKNKESEKEKQISVEARTIDSPLDQDSQAKDTNNGRSENILNTVSNGGDSIDKHINNKDSVAHNTPVSDNKKDSRTEKASLVNQEDNLSSKDVAPESKKEESKTVRKEDKDSVTHGNHVSDKTKEIQTGKESLLINQGDNLNSKDDVQQNKQEESKTVLKDNKDSVINDDKLNSNQGQEKAVNANNVKAETKKQTEKQKTTNAENKPKERKIPINLNKNKQNDPKDCYDYYTKGERRDGLFKVKPLGSDRLVEVFCDMRRGGWTVIQRRQDGTTNFFQEWDDYKKGFGGLYGEHWLGNDNIHLLTNQDYYKLRVDLMDWDKTKKYAEFDYFLVDNEEEGYKLHIDAYNGDAGDGLTKHDGSKFSTKDVDNDKVVKEFGGSCAKRFYGAGWYYKCYSSNLNGKFYKGGKIPEKRFDGITWKPWTGPNYSLKKVEMKIRPASAKK
ncbi:uncharacterized protein LOC123565891 [Mercenaria mercenaria]|uniref:uncharacterized protein LOC123565891 n=1 Tax=Mercenaria mercenaria TaxID=6596 RepID=UPI00234EC00B|nr:uncharacterized protein LOC123565891 [Mercenaria mercenaria]